MVHNWRPRVVVFCLGVSLLCPAIVQGQVTTATVYGNVTDGSGAQIPSAPVVIVNEETGSTQTATTNRTGEFTFTFLPVGRYSLTITATGFKEQTESGIELTAGQRVRRTYALEIGSLTEKVTVTAGKPLVNTVNAEQLISHDTTEVREMPLARRDWTNLLNVGTGVEVRGSGGGTGISMNGMPPGGFSLTVDGTQASASSEETSLTSFGNFNLIKVVSLEAISEVNVNKGIVQAEYANTLSGNIGLDYQERDEQRARQRLRELPERRPQRPQPVPDDEARLDAQSVWRVHRCSHRQEQALRLRRVRRLQAEQLCRHQQRRGRLRDTGRRPLLPCPPTSSSSIRCRCRTSRTSRGREPAGSSGRDHRRPTTTTSFYGVITTSTTTTASAAVTPEAGPIR